MCFFLSSCFPLVCRTVQSIFFQFDSFIPGYLPSSTRGPVRPPLGFVPLANEFTYAARVSGSETDRQFPDLARWPRWAPLGRAARLSARPCGAPPLPRAARVPTALLVSPTLAVFAPVVPGVGNPTHRRAPRPGCCLPARGSRACLAQDADDGGVAALVSSTTPMSALAAASTSPTTPLASVPDGPSLTDNPVDTAPQAAQVRTIKLLS